MKRGELAGGAEGVLSLALGLGVVEGLSITVGRRALTSRPGPKKIDQLRAFMRAEDWRSALRLAARFAVLGDERAAITRAWDALQRPDFYRQLQKDPDALVAEGVAALRRRYP